MGFVAGLGSRRFAVVAAFVIAGVLGFSAPALAATTDTVTNTNNSGPGSLPYVVANAGSGDTVVFASGVTGTISLASVPMQISGSLTIQGPGASTLTIDAGHHSQIFTISTGNVSISGLTLTNGAAGGPGGPVNFSGIGTGGAIEDWSTGSLSISDTTFTDNTAGGAGGGGLQSGSGTGGAIQEFNGALSVSDSTFTGNTAGGAGGMGNNGGDGDGGAINDSASATLTVAGSTFSGNSAGGAGGIGAASGTGQGGAVNDSGALVASDSTFTGNAAGGPGGVSNTGGVGFGGAVVAGSGSSLDSLTIDGNSVGPADGSLGAGIGNAGNMTATATIVSGNTGADNCDAHVSSSTDSLEGPSASDTSCGLDLSSADPRLGALADNGGPTQTQALPAGSPAVDVVSAAHCPTKDQRGEPRPDNGESVCDVGAYELQDVAPAITSPSSATFKVGQAGSFTVTTSGVPTPSISESGALPSGVSFTDNHDGTATLAGTPAAGGTYPLTIKASNGTAPDATQAFTLTVQSPPRTGGPPPSLVVSIVSRRALVSHRRTKLKLSCAGGATGAVCHGTLKLTVRKKTIAHVSYRISSGKTKSVTVRLTRAGLRLLEHAHDHRLKSTATATLTGGHKTSHKVTLKLKPPRTHH